MPPIICELARVKIGVEISDSLETILTGNPLDIQRRWPAADSAERPFSFVYVGIWAKFNLFRIERVANNRLNEYIIRHPEATLKVFVYVFQVINKTKVYDEVKLPELGKIRFKIKLSALEVVNIPMLKSGEVDILSPSIEAEHACSEIGKECSDITMATAKFKHRFVLKEFDAIEFKNFIYALQAPVLIRVMKQPVVVVSDT